MRAAGCSRSSTRVRLAAAWCRRRKPNFQGRIMIKLTMSITLGAVLMASGASAAPPADPGALCPRQTADSTSLDCAAGATICKSWRKFRLSHPFPYQSIHVEMVSQSEAVVIISEPPPVAPANELSEFAGAVFGAGASPARLRIKMGKDGWLDDLAFRVSDLEGPSVDFPSGDGGSLRLPSGLADRLRYLSHHLFGAED